jgi:hypothetical protein
MMINNNNGQNGEKPAIESVRVQYPLKARNAFVISAERASLPPVGG